MTSIRKQLDYDIHGLAGLRLVSPTEPMSRAARRQFDPLRPAPLGREPDIVLERLRRPPAWTRRCELGDAGDGLHSSFDEERLWLTSGGGMFSVDFRSIGETRPWNIAYLPGVNTRRVLTEYVRPVLQLSLLAKGAVAVHSAAVAFNGAGLLFAGWSESGKTEAALGFLRRGATLVSDKWSIVTGDGGTVHNFPTPMTIRGWMLPYLPSLQGNISATDIYRARLATTLEALSQRASRTGVGAKITQLVGPAVSLGTRISVTPSQLLGRQDGAMRLSAPLRAVFLLMTCDGPISVRPASVDEVASRLADCALYEWRNFLNLYRRFAYAYPSRRNTTLETVREAQSEALESALRPAPLFMVETPFPFDPEALYRAVSPFCANG